MGLSVLRPSLSLIPSPLRSRPRSFPVYGRRPAVAVGICKIALPEASPSPAAGGKFSVSFYFLLAHLAAPPLCADTGRFFRCGGSSFRVRRREEEGD